MNQDDRIQPYADNPRYWQMKGRPVLLLGGSKEDNLFQIPDIVEHLDLLVACGGNYVRCTMSSRDDGDVWPFVQRDDGRYDLDQWNDEYWRRFDRFLQLTAERGVVPQIDIWAYHDIYGDVWLRNPFNPACNVNYTTESTRLNEYSVKAHGGEERQPFFWSVPEVNNDTVLLGYQQAFVDKLLSVSFKYDHVLYHMTNEIVEADPDQWSLYWLNYVRGKAAQCGRAVETTEMFWQIDLEHPQHRLSADNPDMCTFFECSQNAASSGQENYDKYMVVRSMLASRPRPMNNVKLYGAGTSTWKDNDQNGLERFWRAVFAGCASARFHRPVWGLGLSERAQAHIRSARIVTDAIRVFECEPRNDLLLERAENEAYCLARGQEAYGVYFPDGGSVVLKIEQADQAWSVCWLNVETSAWHGPAEPITVSSPRLSVPGEGHWVALVGCEQR